MNKILLSVVSSSCIALGTLFLALGVPSSSSVTSSAEDIGQYIPNPTGSFSLPSKLNGNDHGYFGVDLVYASGRSTPSGYRVTCNFNTTITVTETLPDFTFTTIQRESMPLSTVSSFTLASDSVTYLLSEHYVLNDLGFISYYSYPLGDLETGVYTLSGTSTIIFPSQPSYAVGDIVYRYNDSYSLNFFFSIGADDPTPPLPDLPDPETLTLIFSVDGQDTHGDNIYRLSWNALQDVDRYRVERYDEERTEWLTYRETIQGITSLTSVRIESEGKYRVRAFDVYDRVIYSNELNVVFPPPPSITDIFAPILSAVDSFLSINVFGTGFRLGNVLFIAFGIMLFRLVLKLFLGD